MTGGQAFFPISVKEIDKMYDKIQREIAARYSIGYMSTDERTNGAWRRRRDPAEAARPQGGEAADPGRLFRPKMIAASSAPAAGHVPRRPASDAEPAHRLWYDFLIAMASKYDRSTW